MLGADCCPGDRRQRPLARPQVGRREQGGGRRSAASAGSPLRLERGGVGRGRSRGRRAVRRGTVVVPLAGRGRRSEAGEGNGCQEGHEEQRDAERDLCAFCDASRAEQHGDDGQVRRDAVECRGRGAVAALQVNGAEEGDGREEGAEGQLEQAEPAEHPVERAALEQQRAEAEAGRDEQEHDEPPCLSGHLLALGAHEVVEGQRTNHAPPHEHGEDQPVRQRTRRLRGAAGAASRPCLKGQRPQEDEDVQRRVEQRADQPQQRDSPLAEDVRDGRTEAGEGKVLRLGARPASDTLPCRRLPCVAAADAAVPPAAAAAAARRKAPSTPRSVGAPGDQRTASISSATTLGSALRQLQNKAPPSSPRHSCSSVSSRADAVATVAGLAGDITLVVDPVRQVLCHASPAAQHLLCLGPNEVAGRPCASVLHHSEHAADGCDVHDTLTRIALEQNAPDRLCILTDPSGGEGATVMVAGVLPLGPTQVIVRLAALPASKSKGIRFKRESGLPEEVASVVDALADATVITSLTGQVLHINRTFGQLFECELEDVMHKDVGMFIPTAFQKSHAEHVRRLVLSKNRGQRRYLKRHRPVVGQTLMGQTISLDMTVSEMNFSRETVYYIATCRKLMTTTSLARYHSHAGGLLSSLGLDPSPEIRGELVTQPSDLLSSMCSSTGGGAGATARARTHTAEEVAGLRDQLAADLWGGVEAEGGEESACVAVVAGKRGGGHELAAGGDVVDGLAGEVHLRHGHVERDRLPHERLPDDGAVAF
eukprot:Rhum_TRINITY_DN13966_c6_g1::Rhum_TRINITY_DN13966_c6_g1_i1::g.66593::m.66593